MSAEMITVVSEVAKNVSYLQRLKDLATAHPVGAVVAGTVVATVAVVGGYKLATKCFGDKKETKKPAAAPAAAAGPAPEAPAKPAA